MAFNPDDKPLYTLVTVSSLNQYTFVASRFAIILYAVHLQASAATIGVMLAVVGLGGIATSMAAGRWADRVGTRTPMLVCCAGMTLGAVAPVLHGSLASLFIVAALVGGFYNSYYVAQQLLLGRYGNDRVRNFSLSGLGNSIANFVGPLLTGFIIDHLGYTAAFAILAVLPLVPVAFVLAGKLPMQPGQPQPAQQARRQNALALIWQPNLRVIYAFTTVGLVVWQTLQFLLPLYGTQIGLSPSHIGVMVSALPVAGMLSRVVMQFISARYQPWQILMASLAMSAAGLAVLPLLHSLVPVMLASFWLGLGLGTCNPIAQALLYDAAPPERVGEVLSMWTVMSNAAITGVPLAFGAMSAALGMGAVFWALCAAAAGCCYSGRTRFRRAA